MRGVVLRMLVRLGIAKRPELTATEQRVHPGNLDVGQLVVVRDGGIEKWTCFQCPGGCGENIMLSMSRKRRPRWNVHIDWLGRPSVQPSVRMLNDCRCHFWVRRGRVDWCRDSGLR